MQLNMQKTRIDVQKKTSRIKKRKRKKNEKKERQNERKYQRKNAKKTKLIKHRSQSFIDFRKSKFELH